MIEKKVNNRQPQTDIKEAIQLAQASKEDVMVIFDDVFAFVNKDSVPDKVIGELYYKMSQRNFINAFIRPRNK
ncbi:MAG: hypothetical protein IJQ55_01135 [Alphaproteobacteria bacterium]|nr:hypothetical protein [Alphaproteobacteria bacterium]